MLRPEPSAMVSHSSIDSVAVIQEKPVERPSEWRIATGFQEWGFSESRFASCEVTSPEAGEAVTGR